MKDLLWIAALLAACNSTDRTKNAIAQESTIAKEKKTGGSPVACTNMIFFQPGAEIYAKSYSASGKVQGSTHTKIKEVKKENGMTVAYVEASDTSDRKHITNMKYNYKCDGKSIYLDLASMMRSTAQDKDAQFEASLIEYPINVTAGETLPDASGTMAIIKGRKKMTMKYHYKDRKVEGKETVTTPAGTWKCLKISNRVEMEIDFPGLDEKAKKMMQSMTNRTKTTGVTWFSPDFGIVKMELYQNGKLQSKNEVVSVKR
ncbi:TapB family protein [Niastella populi]|uniref:DUF3108 domain-containing protein n=1 Tax=Niastella populi TaxID=550983 RepID=A0A1V9G6J3_9BACT|nr:DUF3108 domain-containing protein [Niastella populi]OQP66207.1 hypothetical protein A4R26_14045 [Niastella populi]